MSRTCLVFRRADVRRFCVICFAALSVSVFAQARLAPAMPATGREEAIVLSPFEVNSGDDKGYAASSARYAMGKPRAALSSGGVLVLPTTRTSSYMLVNPFASYRRKLFGYQWTAQLNVNNVLGLNSDQGNSHTWPRKTEPRQYVTTVTTQF